MMEISKKTGYMLLGAVAVLLLVSWRWDALMKLGAKSAPVGAGFAGGDGNISDAMTATTAQKMSFATAAVGSQTLAG